MKVAKFLPIFVLALLMSACNKPAGELIGASVVGPMGEANPYGMTSSLSRLDQYHTQSSPSIIE